MFKNLAFFGFFLLSATPVAQAAEPSAQDLLNRSVVIKPATLLATDTNMAGIFTITNNGDESYLLLNISSPDCTAIIPNHTGQALVQMQEGEKNIFSNLTLPHNSVIRFPQEGYHLICEGFKRSNDLTSPVPFIFHFPQGDVKVLFNVKKS